MATIEIDPVQLLINKARRNKTGKKDRLDKDAAAATEKGLSYGKYKALEREGLLPTQDQTDEEGGTDKPAPAEFIEGPVRRRQVRVDYHLRPCERCGEMYKPHAINSKYCCDNCRNLAWAARHRAAKKASRINAQEAQA